jgi:hypothetical protein
LAGGLGDLEDLADVAVRVPERLPQHVHRPFVGRQALHEGEDGVRDCVALLDGLGRVEHRIAREQRLREPLAHVGLASCSRRRQLVEAQVGHDLGQPRLRHVDVVDLSAVPAQERFLHDVLRLRR